MTVQTFVQTFERTMRANGTDGQYRYVDQDALDLPNMLQVLKTPFPFHLSNRALFSLQLHSLILTRFIQATWRPPPDGSSVDRNEKFKSTINCNVRLANSIPASCHSRLPFSGHRLLLCISSPSPQATPVTSHCYSSSRVFLRVIWFQHTAIGPQLQHPREFVAQYAVDIFNAYTMSWSFAQLSEKRCFLAATSLPSQGMAFFAGGFNGALKHQCSQVRILNSCT
jgi:hypothetical protein